MVVKRGEGPTKEWDRLWITGGSTGIGKAAVVAEAAEKEDDDVDAGDEDEGLGFEVGFWL